MTKNLYTFSKHKQKLILCLVYPREKAYYYGIEIKSAEFDKTKDIGKIEFVGNSQK
jgi:hypothetical protein